MSDKNALPNVGLVAPSWGHLVVPIAIVVMLGAMIVPMPPFALDLLISCDIAISMIVSS